MISRSSMAGKTTEESVMRRRALRTGVTFLFGAILIPTGAVAASGPPSPPEERAALRLADESLTIELVAAEPAVISPVAIAWDAAGRLFVAEMIDYPASQPSGRVKLLEDRDGDGSY